MEKNQRSWGRLTCHWLKWALYEGGYNSREIGEKYHVSGTRIRQIAIDWGLDPGRGTKTPLWHATRAGNKKLADKEWIKEKLKEAGSIKELSRALNIETWWLAAQLKRLGIDHSDIKKVNGICAYCKETITKSGSDIYVGQNLMFCDQDCYNKFRHENGRNGTIKHKRPAHRRRVKCAYCGKRRRKPDYKFRKNQRHKFCDTKCYNAFRHNGGKSKAEVEALQK